MKKEEFEKRFKEALELRGSGKKLKNKGI